MLTLSWILWFINLYWFNLTVKDLALYLGIAEIENIFRTLERAEMPLLDSITLFTKMTAHLWLYFLMGAISSIYLLWKSIVQKKYMGEASFFAPLFLLYLTLCSTSYLYIPVGTVRSFNYVIFTSTILTGFTISKILEEKTEINEKKLLKTTLLTILLLPSIVFSQLNMYPSPFIKSVSDQVASSVVLGFKLFLTYQTEQLLIEDTGLNQKTKILAITGHKSIPPNVRDWQKVQQSLPEHFGYITYPNLGMWYQEDRYLIIDEMTMIYHEKAIPEYKKAWRWTSEDFDRLDHDFSVYRTYDNGGFWIFYVIALRKP